MNSDVILDQGDVKIVGDHFCTDLQNGEIKCSSDLKIIGSKLSTDIQIGEFNCSTSFRAGCAGRASLTLAASGYIVCKAYSLVLNNPDAASSGQMRMALLQTADDQLVLNGNGNYTKGVKIEGQTTLGRAWIDESVTLAYGSKLIAVLDRGHTIQQPGGGSINLPPSTIDLVQAIKDLQTTVQDMQRRISALEAKLS